MTPFGGHKGYGLALVVELLAGAVAGGEDYLESGEGEPNLATSSTVIIAFDPGLFRSIDAYFETVERIVGRIKGAGKAPDHDEIFVPGEPEVATRAKRSAKGIPIAESIWEEVGRAAAGVGYELLEV